MPRASIFVAAGGTSANGEVGDREKGNESPTELFLEEEGQFLHSRPITLLSLVKEAVNLSLPDRVL